MGDGPDRVVTAPATKATGYGIAAAQSVARALGEAVGAVGEAAQSLETLLSDALSAWWVQDARAIWADLATDDASLRKTVILDLGTWAPWAAKTSGKRAIAALPKMGYGAWTNSSSLVLVTPDLFDQGDPVPKILLSHEAEHVRQFRSNGDRPPGTYWEMARFEHDAYGRTCKALDALVDGGATELAETRDGFRAVVNFFGAIAAQPRGTRSEADILRAFVTYTYQGEKDPLLPPEAGPTPDSLYVR